MDLILAKSLVITSDFVISGKIRIFAKLFVIK